MVTGGSGVRVHVGVVVGIVGAAADDVVVDPALIVVVVVGSVVDRALYVGFGVVDRTVVDLVVGCL